MLVFSSCFCELHMHVTVYYKLIVISFGCVLGF